MGKKNRIRKLRRAIKEARKELRLDPTQRTCWNVAADLKRALKEDNDGRNL